MQWAFEIPKKKEKAEDPSKDRAFARKFPASIPYILGISEQLQRVLRSHGVPFYHKPFNTLRSLLVSHGDKTQKECGVCTVWSVVCEKVYIGETARTLRVRFKGELMHF